MPQEASIDFDAFVPMGPSMPAPTVDIVPQVIPRGMIEEISEVTEEGMDDLDHTEVSINYAFHADEPLSARKYLRSPDASPEGASSAGQVDDYTAASSRPVSPPGALSGIRTGFTRGQMFEPLLPPSAPAMPGGGLVSQLPKDHVVEGMLWYAASSLFFAAMGIFSKVLAAQGFPVFQISLFRSMTSMTLIISSSLSAGKHPLGNRRGLLLLRGSIGYLGITSYYLSCHLLPLADATALSFLSPLVTAVLSPWILKERLSPATAIVIPLCIAGVVLITQPTFIFGASAANLSALGVLAGLVHPVFNAGAKMMIRLLRFTENTNSIILYLESCVLLYSAVGCMLAWSTLVVPSLWHQYAAMLCLGVCAYGLQFCSTKGISKAQAAPVMCMQYFSIVVNQIAGMLVFSEFTTLWADVGMCVIVFSMLWYMLHEARAKTP